MIDIFYINGVFDSESSVNVHENKAKIVYNSSDNSQQRKEQEEGKEKENESLQPLHPSILPVFLMALTLTLL
jgi:hypothetical protein